jgi:nitroreductase
MTLYEAIMQRRSVRKFQDRDVPDDLLAEAMSLAGRGPSAGAIRGYRGIVTRPGLAYGAPVSVVICIDEAAYEKRYGERGRTLYAVQDAAIYGAFLGLLLVERGLHSVWVGAFREERVRRAVGTKLRPVAIIALGYAI